MFALKIKQNTDTLSELFIHVILNFLTPWPRHLETLPGQELGLKCREYTSEYIIFEYKSLFKIRWVYSTSKKNGTRDLITSEMTDLIIMLICGYGLKWLCQHSVTVWWPESQFNCTTTTDFWLEEVTNVTWFVWMTLMFCLLVRLKFYYMPVIIDERLIWCWSKLES